MTLSARSIRLNAATSASGSSRPLLAGWLFALLVYLLLACFQLGLPGLHYDEAREAGQNAMELLTGAPVMVYRGATLDAGGLHLPLMVQEYIGALNVYLSLPFLWLTGVGVPNLRAVGVLTGALTLILLERAVTAWVAGKGQIGLERPARLPLSPVGVGAMLLLAAAPGFVFWSRQGIFVTNLMQPLILLSIWQGLLWRRDGRSVALLMAAAAAGLALYAKLLAIWVLAPLALLLLADWLATPRAGRPSLRAALVATAVAAFVIPLLPLLLFNLQTGGTLFSLGERLGTSYYGVNNRDLWGNLLVRLPQLVMVLRGDHLWYLGGLYANVAAPWLAALAVVLGLAADRRRVGPPLLLIGATVTLSLFTVSDLFMTHYALLAPLLAGTVAIAGGSVARRAMALGRRARPVAMPLLLAALVLWVASDLYASLQYHRALLRSGGLADHSDATYALAYHLRTNGMGAPIALDWGMDATLRFLSNGSVTPVEIFGYDSPAAPDADFAARLAPFLARNDAVFLLRAPGSEVFAGRREVFVQEATTLGVTPLFERSFAQRDGTPLFEIWRLHRP